MDLLVYCISVKLDGEELSVWMNKLFIPKVQPYLESGPVVLFFDRHHSHLSVTLITTCNVQCNYIR